MRPAPTMPSIDEIRNDLIAAGAIRVGVAAAGVLERARSALEDRRAQGYADSMQFTWRNPERSTNPSASVEGARSLIAAAWPVDVSDVPAPSGARARVARYAQDDHYAPLRTALRSVARRLRIDGHRAVAFVDDNAIVDREVAYLAGIGWFGRNANILVPGVGSHVVLGCIVTTVEFPADRPVPDGCGSCTRCIDDCPTGAIVGPGVVDARRCLAWILQRPGSIPEEFRTVIHDRIYGCDDCQEVCPPTIRLSPRLPTRRGEPGPGQWVDPWAIAFGDDGDLLDRFGRWYLHGRNPRWLRRNAVIAIGNTADPNDRTVDERLAALCEDDDEIVAEHAAWARRRLAERATVESS